MNNMNVMLEAVSKKLGTTPEKLREALQTGDFSKAMENMNPKDAAKLNAVLNNPELVKKIVNSKKAQELKNQMENKQ